MDLSNTEERIIRIFGRQRHVLIVEDNPHDMELLKAQWTDIGINVGEAPTGEKALELASRFVYDFAIVDLNLPRISGAEVIEKLWPHMPIAAITGASFGRIYNEVRKKFPVLTIYEKPFTTQHCVDLLRLLGMSGTNQGQHGKGNIIQG